MGSPALKVRTLSPRVKHGLRMYVTGVVNTKYEASRLAGLHPQYLQIIGQNPIVKAYVRKLEEQIDNGTVDMAASLQEIGRRAVARIASLMESDNVKDEVRLKAAVDLADRSPETSKTNKISLEGDVTLRQGDASRLMAALVEASQAAETYRKEVSEGDYVKVDTELPPAILPPALNGDKPG